jgi:hypothetical protein
MLFKMRHAFKNLKKNPINIALFTISLILSFKFTYHTGETFFFDKLFYRKSHLHGYSQFNPFGNPIGQVGNFNDLEKSIQSRLIDLYQLMYVPDQKKTGEDQTDQEFTIAFIGDSMSFGTGVKENQTLVSILEKKLNKLKPTRVINYSMPGDNILDNYAKYKEARGKKHIDLFIIGIVDNDLLLNESHAQYPQSKELYSQLLNSCEKELKTFPYESLFTWEEQIEEIHFPSLSEDYANISYFREIVSLLDDSDTFFFSFGYVSQEQQDESTVIDSTSKFWQIFAKYDEIIKNDGNYLLNPYSIYPQYLQISNQEKHPSKKMHQQYAEVLFDEITTNSKWKFID